MHCWPRRAKPVGAAQSVLASNTVSPSWSVGVEYDHLFMGSRNVTLTGPLFSETEHIKQDVDMGLVRLNYRFGGFGGFSAPVAARY